MFRKPERLFMGAVSLLVALIVLRTLLVGFARYTPAPLSSAARTLGSWADPGNV